MNLFLIGYRCTGKTTVGKILADRLKWAFVDTDQAIVESSETGITRMVAEHGWPFFRKQERKILKTVSEEDQQVVATGGGIVLDNRNISVMQTSGRIVWLTASRRTIEVRMLADDSTASHRPSLTEHGLIGEITSVLSERIPLYEMAADLVIDTEQEKITGICDRIQETFGF